MKFIEVTAKKVPDAIEQGLKELGLTIDDVTVEVIEQGGLFKKAKVRLTVDEPEQPEKPVISEKPAKPEKPAPAENKQSRVEPAAGPAKLAKQDKPTSERSDKPQKPEKSSKPEKSTANATAEKPTDRSDKSANSEARQKPKKKDRAEHKSSEDELQALAQAHEFIKTLVEKMGFDATVAPSADDPEKVTIAAPQGDDSLIIGRHGETLSAIQYLAETGARAEKHHINIVVDCNGYRDRRAASLSAMARRKADECVKRNRKIKLEPMERIDRRTVHFALGDDDRVSTASEGKEPHRYVVIFPKN